MISNSLDDTIIIRKNLLLLDNVTNLNKPAIDYFHHNFQETYAICETWKVLLKVGKHKVLRLPSCSQEDESDYNYYLKRLHHCLWRRWSMENFQLNGNENKYDPLRINWNKENDMTVLYGPQLSDDCVAATQLIPKKKSSPDSMFSAMDMDSDLESYSQSYNNYSSSPTNSDASSIFENSKPILVKTNSSGFGSPPSHHSNNKNIRFDDSVRTREIDHSGVIYDGTSAINDTWANEMIMRQDCFILDVHDSDEENDEDYEMEL
ncbi:hypothetical protein KDRO_F03590 [Kluyveromyces lactis]|uniref:KLLA0F16489p n=1 Tax=Kluyveromyces lactis (strain ATCC 8585 / CBS 2359 / DSM 70799 / NBRC 1267 / NRRL Y-1140 / WM37) TaxID=284590 RepID=Q6CJR8_KLULA|nr:uncharacterized protein KLLA0_F16489g [Kluyveromyces lactis]QEU62431.1 hypothetical protein KDRO_F03590 [Kluyveromyces lactis]CAG98529.1 KLLA0F16489p [Kluyveromyces lactis]|eukprot:XP_455821.1 uncharacterized protein KLLA0_F16489g [Kluyveromyces lactis]